MVPVSNERSIVNDGENLMTWIAGLFIGSTEKRTKQIGRANRTRESRSSQFKNLCSLHTSVYGFKCLYQLSKSLLQPVEPGLFCF